MIKVNNLSKKFDNKIVYDDVSFTLNNRSAVVGLNGCGKTTLLNIILGLDKDYKGSVESSFNNASCVFSINSLPEFLCIYDIIKSRKLDLDLLDKYLQLFDASEYKNVIIKDLSLGTKTKMNIIFTLLWDSDYLFFDEVTNSLDYQSIKKLKELLISQDRNMLIISHDFLFLDGLVDQITVIEAPNKVTQITYDEYKDSSKLNEVIDKIIESDNNETVNTKRD